MKGVVGTGKIQIHRVLHRSKSYGKGSGIQVCDRIHQVNSVLPPSLTLLYGCWSISPLRQLVSFK